MTDGMGQSIGLRRKLLAVALLGGAIGFIVWRIPYGYGFSDECYPLATAYRLCLGDALVADEWFLGQFSQLLMLPFVWLYLKFAGSLDGVVIASRWLFAVIVTCAGLYHFAAWRRFSFGGALAGAMAFILFAPFSIMAFAYYAIEVVCFSVVMTSLLAYEGFSRWRSLAVGVFLALSVMGDPYLAVFYFIYLGYELARGRNLARWLLVTAGVLAVALPVAGFVLARASIGEILEQLPHIFSDPYHPRQSFGLMARIWKAAVIGQQPGLTPTMMWVMVGVALAGRLVHDRRGVARGVAMCALAVIGAVWVYLAVFKSYKPFPDFLMLPAAFSGLCAAILAPSALGRRYLALGVIGAALCSFCSSAASDQDFFRIGQCMTVILVPSAVMLFAAAQRVGGKMLRTCAIVVCVVFSACLVAGIGFRRYSMVFADRPMRALTTKIRTGTHRGCVTTEANAEAHARGEAELGAILKANDAERVMFTHGGTMWHLMAGRKFGTYTAWVGPRGHLAFQRVDAWNRLHPGKQADLVFFGMRDPELEGGFAGIGYEKCGEMLGCSVLKRAAAPDGASGAKAGDKP